MESKAGNILIIGYFSEWAAHHAVELELAQSHLNKGDAVSFLLCDGTTGGCVVNPEGQAGQCRDCVMRRLDAIHELDGEVGVYYLGDYFSTDDEMLWPDLDNLNNVDDYKKFDYGVDLGWGALSTTISLSRDAHYIDLEVAKEFIKKALVSYSGVKSFLGKAERYDKIYIFNGRFATTRGAFRASQSMGYKPTMHERGGSKDYYRLCENEMPFSKQLFREIMNEMWEASDEKKRMEVAEDFYSARRKGEERKWHSFTKRQRPGALPAGFCKEKKNYIIYTSSEDEWAAIGQQWGKRVYRSQSFGIKKIVDDLACYEMDVHFYIRMHPNLTGVSNDEIRSLESLGDFDNCTYIPPDSDISSYALLDASDVVITFGSTMGIEASYWGKPSILIGSSLYEGLGAVYEVESHDELVELLIRNELAPLDREGAMKFANRSSDKGIGFEYWRAETFGSGWFKSVYLQDCKDIVARGRFRKMILYPLLKSKRISNRFIFEMERELFDGFMPE